MASARLSRFLTRKTLEEYVDSEDGPKVPHARLALTAPSSKASPINAAAAPPDEATLKAPAAATSAPVEAAADALRADGALAFAVRGASLGWGVAEPLMDPKTAKKYAKYGGGKGGKGGGKGEKKGKGGKGQSAGAGKGGTGGKGAPDASPAADDGSTSVSVAAADTAAAAAPPPPAPDPVCLQNLTFSVKRGALVAVVGPVGSGKSSLLAALTGEMQLLEGSVGRSKGAGQVALAAQVPWVVNSTLRENVTFGAPFDADKCVRRRALYLPPFTYNYPSRNNSNTT